MISIISAPYLIFLCFETGRHVKCPMPQTYPVQKQEDVKVKRGTQEQVLRFSLYQTKAHCTSMQNHSHPKPSTKMVLWRSSSLPAVLLGASGVLRLSLIHPAVGFSISNPNRADL